MRYIDSGSRDATDAVGTWLDAEAATPIEEFRMQSGYFSLDGLGPVATTLRTISAAGKVVRVVVGSNEGATLGRHVEELAMLLAMPRSEASLGVVSFGNALFHPKTLHIRRGDGSQAAYVGSANVGVPGISGLNVEAGLILDEREGDAVSVIAEVGSAVDAWFSKPRPGLDEVRSAADVPGLVASGILAQVRPPRVTAGGGAGAGGGGRPGLAPLLKLAPVLPPAGVPGAQPGPVAAQPSATRAGFPPLMRFAPNAAAPTAGTRAVSGASLPGGATGVVLRLSKDTARHWQGGVGTANISIPVDALEPLRFGFSANGKPRAEFELEGRRIHGGGADGVAPAPTNVMGYGYGAQPTGHRDVRMVLPKPAADALGAAARRRGAAPPAAGDYAILEWPTVARPTFRLSVVDPAAPVYGNLLALVAAATQAGTLLGAGGCWLPPGVSPSW